MRTPLRFAATILTATLGLARVDGAPQAAPAQGRGGGGVFAPITEVPYSDYTGYMSLWAGKTFKGWDGETDVWSLDNGAIHADTAKTPGQHHLHNTGPGAVIRDFD